jgi:hypothetical protein
MSTKTTFKRIALVAVAALGLGVLSVAPSQATISGLTVTVANGTSTLDGAASDSTTAATVNITGLLEVGDSVTANLVLKSAPVGGTSAISFINLDSSTATMTGYTVESFTTASGALDQAGTAFAVNRTTLNAAHAVRITKSTAAGNINHTFGIQLDSATSGRIAGSYVYSVVVKAFDNTRTTSAPTTTIVKDVTITIAASPTVSKTVDPSKTTAYINSGSTWGSQNSDSAVAVVATASATDHAVIRVALYNAASGTTAQESITATITGAGVVCNSSICGKSITIAGSGTANDFTVRADGTAGTGSIVIKTTTVTFPAKTVTFFAKAAKTITLAVNKPVISTGSATDVIRATAVDADGNVWGGAAYIYAASAADALIAGSETPAACTFNSAKGYHECPVSGTAKGTANFKVIDAATVALATATSASAAVRVSTGVATSAKISFDAATYAPGAKATVLVTVLDAEGLALPASTITNAFAADIASSVAFSSGNLTGSASPVLAAATSASSATTAGSAQYTVYMPFASGDVTLTATGSTGLAASGRVAVTATASVVNSSVDAATDAANEATDAANAATDAALAAADAADAATAAAQDASDAVAALSASVSKLISSLRAQITSLTNLVIKIQKKVRA